MNDLCDESVSRPAIAATIAMIPLAHLFLLKNGGQGRVAAFRLLPRTGYLIVRPGQPIAGVGVSWGARTSTRAVTSPCTRSAWLGSLLVDREAPMQPRVLLHARSGGRGLAVSKSEGSARLSGGNLLGFLGEFSGALAVVRLKLFRLKKERERHADGLPAAD